MHKIFWIKLERVLQMRNNYHSKFFYNKNILYSLYIYCYILNKAIFLMKHVLISDNNFQY